MVNPLANSEAAKSRKMTAQEICDEGNARLQGLTPYRDGEFHPRPDVHWFVENGRATLGWKTRA